MVSEAARLHAFHCTGCTEYGSHGGERKIATSEGRTLRGERNEGFDSPPPPSTHEHTPECFDC